MAVGSFVVLAVLCAVACPVAVVVVPVLRLTRGRAEPGGFAAQ